MKVKVWNDNTFDYHEKFQDEDIIIKAKSYIEMDDDKAVLFKGTMNKMEFDGSGVPLPQSYKRIRVEGLYDHLRKPTPLPQHHVCQFDGKELSSEAELNQYIADNYIDKIENKDFAKEFQSKTKLKKTA